MGKWLRRIRGAIGMAFVWGLVWGAVGSIPRWVFGFNTDVPFPVVFGALGFVAGLLFSAILVLAEGHRRFDQMSLPRFAAWGAVGGLLLAVIFSPAASLGRQDVLAIVPTFAAACAVCAVGSFALARRTLWRELLDGRGDSAEA